MPKGRKGQGPKIGKGKNASIHNDKHVMRPGIKELPKELHPSFYISHNGQPPIEITAKLPEITATQTYLPIFNKLVTDETVVSVDKIFLGLESANAIKSFERNDEKKYQGHIELTNEHSNDVFLKRVHIIDPIEYLSGNYNYPSNPLMPVADIEGYKNVLNKINDPLNEAYTDALFASFASKVVEREYSPHWCRFYGTYCGISDTYLFNISDEYQSLKYDRDFVYGLNEGKYKIYSAEEVEPLLGRTRESYHAKTADAKSVKSFETADDSLDEEVEEIEDVEEPDKVDDIGEIEEVDFSNENVEEFEINAPKVRVRKCTQSEEEEEIILEGGEEDDDEEVYIELPKFPVLFSLLELCNGTLDDLIDEVDNKIDIAEHKWIAWIFQVIAALTFAQHHYGFVHNDLHSNNIMWTPTNEEFLYYQLIQPNGQKINYKVPTYGKIMKIIDFGRASYWIQPTPGFIISDAFYPGNDAGTQYNCEPFFDKEDGEKVEPNPSFDLARLAVSIIDSLYETRPENATPLKVMSREKGKMYMTTVSPLYNLMWEWLTDTKGENILVTPADEERYPDFELYRAIARSCHNCIPKEQIRKPIFKDVFEMNGPVPKGTKQYVLNL